MNEYRIPLFLRKRNNVVYFQMQVEVAREDGLCAGRYFEYDKASIDAGLNEIGTAAKKLISRFQELSDLDLSEFQALTGTDMASYRIQDSENCLKAMEVKTEKELDDSFIECDIHYDIKMDHYFFTLCWTYKEGRKKWNDSSYSTGKQGIFTFKEPLEFDEDVASEHLGEMILEAFDRSRKMAEVMSSGTLPAKEIDCVALRSEI